MCVRKRGRKRLLFWWSVWGLQSRRRKNLSRSKAKNVRRRKSEKFRRLLPHNELLKQPTNEPSRRGFRE